MTVTSQLAAVAARIAYGLRNDARIRSNVAQVAQHESRKERLRNTLHKCRMHFHR